MKVLVVGGGQISNSWDCQSIIEACDYIVCADSGAEFILNKGIVPDTLLGDFDSLKSDMLTLIRKSDCKVLEYPPEKNYTDSELALRYAIDLNPDSIVMMGFTGSRMDHSLANINLLTLLEEKNIEGIIYNETNYITLMDSRNEISIGRNEWYKYISLIPITRHVSKVSITGVKYPLKDKDLVFGETLSISNEIVKERCFIKKGKGAALIIQSKD